MRSILLLTISLVLLSSFLFGQSMTVNTSIYTAEELVQDVLINGCVTADNITNVGNFSGSNAAIGYFNANGTSFPFNAGIILSSGLATEAPGSGGTFASTSLGLGGDNDLDDLLSGFWSSQDAVILEFDFVPSSDTIQFRYIFGSEEYPEYVNSSYNDVFGFFITGPNPAGGNYNSQNIALIPGTSNYVSIDNVNNGTNNTGPCTNCSYYVNNSSGSITVYDGLTTPLTAWALVTPCQTYHIKLAIADAGDQIYDSGVFIEAGSFSSGGQVSMNNPDPIYGSNNDLYEGCQNYYVFSRMDPDDTSYPIQVDLQIGGNAQQGDGSTAGDDITEFPTSFVIPVGQVYDTIWYTAYADGTTEGTEYIVISLLSGCPCSMNAVNDTIYIYDDIPFKASLISQDVNYCDGNYPPTLDLEAVCQSHPPDFVTFSWSTGVTEFGSWNAIDEVAESIETVSPTLGVSTYYVTIADLCGNQHIDSVNIIVSDMMPPVITTTDDLNGTCSGQIHVTPNGGFSPYTLQWWYNNNFQSAWTNQTDLTGLCSGQYKLIIFDDIGCSDTTIISIEHVSSPIANFTSNYTAILTGGSVTFTDLSEYNPTSWAWSFAGGSPASSNSQNPTVSYPAAGSYSVTLTATNPYGSDTETKSGYITVSQSTPPVADFSANNTVINAGESVTFTDLSSNSPTAWNWVFTGGSPNGSYLQTPPSITYYSAGTYNVQLTVANTFGNDSETKSSYITVVAAAVAPVAEFSPTNAQKCTGSPITFTDQSDNYPTSWSWTFENGSPATSTSQNPMVIWDTPGTYVVTLSVTNSEGTDSETAYVTITAPPTVTFSTMPTDCGAATGSAAAAVNGGSGTIFYNWSTGANTSYITNLSAGLVSLTVTDASNCVVTQTVTISDDGGVSAAVDVNHVNCYGSADGSATITPSGGVAPYSYVWSNGNTAGTATNLAANIYSVTVTDANTCATATNVIVNQPDQMSVNYALTNASAPGAADGAISISGVSNGTAPYTYLWEDSSTGTGISNIQAGNYSVTVTDATGCTYVETISVLNGTSIDEAEIFSSVVVYPNPTHGEVTIDFGDTQVDYIKVIDMLGKVIFESPTSGSVSYIDLSNYAEGVYYLELRSETFSHTRKITLKK